jgi:hypothetical protein
MNSTGQVVTSLAALVVCVVIAVAPCDGVGAEPAGITEGETARVIRWLMRPSPARRLYRDAAARAELAAVIDAAAAAHGFDAVLLAVWAYAESSYMPEATGALGAVGLLQVHGPALEGCADLETPAGQMDCGARWMRGRVDHCGGDLRRGLLAYASGSCGGTARARRQVDYRLYLVREARRAVAPGGKT